MTHDTGGHVKGVRATWSSHQGERMGIHNENLHVALDDDRIEVIEHVVAEVEDDIHHGRVSDDVSHVLAERLEAAGVSLAPEAVDDLAEAIENDVSL
jgi:hypothetical protein